MVVPCVPLPLDSSGGIIIFRRKCISEPCTFHHDAVLRYPDRIFATGMLTGSIILMLPLVPWLMVFFS